MKVLHTKAVTEPILLTTTCHNMNLLAIVTRSLVVVYRSTTLTAVMSLALSLKEDETTVSACWSPSGRLLTVGLQSGEAYLLDVEGGDLVRRFVPRTGMALAIQEAKSSSHSDDDITPAVDAGNDNDNGEEKTVDPLHKPPTVPISVEGAIVACTWTSATPSAASMNSHKEFCLPLRATVSSSILEELEREAETPVMLLLDQKGRISFLPGGLLEVCVLLVNLPWSIDPRCLLVESFIAGMPPPTETNNKDTKNKSNSDCYGGSSTMAGSRDAADSRMAYLVVQDASVKGSTHILSKTVRIHLSDILTGVTAPETVAICCISEYSRMGKVSFQHAQRRWKALIQTLRKDLLLPKNVMLLRDALVEDIARPVSGELLAYFRNLDLSALVKNAEELSRQFAHLVVQVSNVAYRCYDIALHLSQVHSIHRQRQCLLTDVISSLRQRCNNFMRQMRLEAEREKELVQWVVQRASLLTNSVLPASELFAAHTPLRAVRHPSLLRTLHRIWRGESTTHLFPAECRTQNEEQEGNDNNEDDSGGENDDVELSRIVKECFLGSRETIGYTVPLPNVGKYKEADLLQRLCEVLVTDNDLEDGIQLHAVAATKVFPSQPFISSYALETQSNGGVVFVASQDDVAVQTEPLKFTTTGATFLWGGRVDNEGRFLLLWECSSSLSSLENTLVLALMGESGAIEMRTSDDEDKYGDGEQSVDEEKKPQYAVLEIKGISTQHLRVSASRARGFAVIYAKERFVVVDIYGG